MTGVPAEAIVEAARLYATTPRAMLLYGLGVTQHVCGTENVMALSNLALVTGNVGVEGAGINPLRGQNNVQGACDMGALPDVLHGLPEGRRLRTRARGSSRPGAPSCPNGRASPRSGMQHAARDGRAARPLIMGEDPVVTDPASAHVSARSTPSTASSSSSSS